MCRLLVDGSVFVFPLQFPGPRLVEDAEFSADAIVSHELEDFQWVVEKTVGLSVAVRVDTNN